MLKKIIGKKESVTSVRPQWKEKANAIEIRKVDIELIIIAIHCPDAYKQAIQEIFLFCCCIYSLLVHQKFVKTV